MSPPIFVPSQALTVSTGDHSPENGSIVHLSEDELKLNGSVDVDALSPTVKSEPPTSPQVPSRRITRSSKPPSENKGKPKHVEREAESTLPNRKGRLSHEPSSKVARLMGRKTEHDEDTDGRDELDIIGSRGGSPVPRSRHSTKPPSISLGISFETTSPSSVASSAARPSADKPMEAPAQVEVATSTDAETDRLPEDEIPPEDNEETQMDIDAEGPLQSPITESRQEGVSGDQLALLSSGSGAHSNRSVPIGASAAEPILGAPTVESEDKDGLMDQTDDPPSLSNDAQSAPSDQSGGPQIKDVTVSQTAGSEPATGKEVGDAQQPVLPLSSNEAVPVTSSIPMQAALSEVILDDVGTTRVGNVQASPRAVSSDSQHPTSDFSMVVTDPPTSTQHSLLPLASVASSSTAATSAGALDAASMQLHPSSLSAQKQDAPAVTLTSTIGIDSADPSSSKETATLQPSLEHQAPIPQSVKPQDTILSHALRSSTPGRSSSSSYNGDSSAQPSIEGKSITSPTAPHHNAYTLPPLKQLPAEYQRRGKGRSQRKKQDRDRGLDRRDKTTTAEDWAPLGINKWGITMHVNPVFDKVSKATKCLTSHDWSVSSAFPS